MELETDQVPAVFVARDNRFRVTVRVEGRPAPAHLRNSGRLKELLQYGRRVFLRPAPASPRRKTQYDLLMVDLDGVLVSVDAGLPNALVGEALQEGTLAPFQEYETVRREVSLGASRLDFMLEHGDDRCFIEVKSVTLVRGRLALFPDAPTLRGHRHVEELRRAVAEGIRGAVVFVAQREDAHSFAPNYEADPVFSHGLRCALHEGVEVYGYACRVTPREVRIDRPLAVGLNMGAGSARSSAQAHSRPPF